MNLLDLQKLAEQGYAGGEALGECEYFDKESGEPTDWHTGDILQWFVAVEIAESFDGDETDQKQLANAITTLERALLDVQGAIGALRHTGCRFCEHLRNAAPPRQKPILMCEYQLSPETCGKYQLAECYEGHDPREQRKGVQ